MFLKLPYILLLCHTLSLPNCNYIPGLLDEHMVCSFLFCLCHICLIECNYFVSTVKTGMYTIYQVEQLHKIFKLCGSPSEEYWKKSKLPHATIFKPQQPYKRCIRETFKDFPTSALPLVETLLAIDPADRHTATAALQSDVCSYLFSSF